jgi:hypothetical protein
MAQSARPRGKPASYFEQGGVTCQWQHAAILSWLSGCCLLARRQSWAAGSWKRSALKSKEAFKTVLDAAGDFQLNPRRPNRPNRYAASLLWISPKHFLFGASSGIRQECAIRQYASSQRGNCPKTSRNANNIFNNILKLRPQSRGFPDRRLRRHFKSFLQPLQFINRIFVQDSLKTPVRCPSCLFLTSSARLQGALLVMNWSL